MAHAPRSAPPKKAATMKPEGGEAVMVGGVMSEEGKAAMGGRPGAPRGVPLREGGDDEVCMGIGGDGWGGDDGWGV